MAVHTPQKAKYVRHCRGPDGVYVCVTPDFSGLISLRSTASDFGSDVTKVGIGFRLITSVLATGRSVSHRLNRAPKDFPGVIQWSESTEIACNYRILPCWASSYELSSSGYV